MNGTNTSEPRVLSFGLNEANQVVPLDVIEECTVELSVPAFSSTPPGLHNTFEIPAGVRMKLLVPEGDPPPVYSARERGVLLRKRNVNVIRGAKTWEVH